MIPFVTINLDRPRQLRFTMKSMIEFEQLTDINLADFNGRISADMATKLLWIMLKRDDPSLTLEQTIILIDDHAEYLGDVLDRVTEAVSVALYTKNVGKDPNAKKSKG